MCRNSIWRVPGSIRYRLNCNGEGTVVSRPTRTDASILVASDNTSDAELVKKLLKKEFEKVLISTNPDKAVEDFERNPPEVMVLAFDTLVKSERYYLELYRRSQKIHLQSHRTVILCNKDEVWRAYELCRKDLFDDYILFWPMTHDAPRLPMSVHLALRELTSLKNVEPTSAQFAAQARHLVELETLLAQRMAQGGGRIESTGRCIAQAEQDLGAALDAFAWRLTHGELPDMPDITGVNGLEREIARIKREEIRQGFHSVTVSMEPLKQWANQLNQEFQPHLEAVHSLKAMADRTRAMVLVVDDDEFQRKMVGKILETENYHLVFAAGGVEALSVLRKIQPDLILMDVMMPDMDGMETTRRLKTLPQFTNVPVVMATGKSVGNVVTDSLKAGAIDFVVKPFDRETLIGKIARALCTTIKP